MPGTAAGDDADLPGPPGVSADQRPATGVGGTQRTRVGREDAVDRLVDEVLRIVDDLAHQASSATRTSTSTPYGGSLTESVALPSRWVSDETATSTGSADWLTSQTNRVPSSRTSSAAITRGSSTRTGRGIPASSASAS